MSYPIKYLSLQKSELIYEVSLRGLTPGDSVEELRRQIVKLANELPAEDILESFLTPNEDLNGANDSLTKANNNIQLLKSAFDKNLYSRTENLLNQLYHRINRITPTPDTTELYKLVCSNFKLRYKELLGMKPHKHQSQTSSEKQVETTVTSVTCERNLMSDIGKLKYSGKTCARAFIQKVEEFAVSRSISHDKILTFAYEIFTDDALHWYRCVKDSIGSWEELVKLLKEDFSSKDYDYRLLSEIRARTQGEGENITVYLSIMHGMFARLDKSMNEDDKLEIILHNIRPCYASTLAAANDIKSITQLKTLCRNYENIQSRMSQFHEPPKASSDTLAPEFAYKNTNSYTNSYKRPNNNYSRNFNNYKSYPNNYTKNNSDKSIPVAAVSSGDETYVETKRRVYCPRCRSDTHSLRQCFKPRFLICFKCGKKDVRYPDCPDCHSDPKN